MPEFKRGAKLLISVDGELLTRVSSNCLVQEHKRITLARASAIIISYPTKASGIIVLLKTPQKYSKLNLIKLKKRHNIARMLTIFVDHMDHSPWWLSQ